MRYFNPEGYGERSIGPPEDVSATEADLLARQEMRLNTTYANIRAKFLEEVKKGPVTYTVWEKSGGAGIYDLSDLDPAEDFRL